MKTFGLVASGLLAAACVGYIAYDTWRSMPPKLYSEIQKELHERIVYKHYAAKDWRYIKPGEKSEGNCAVFAYTAFMELTKHNIQPNIKLCRVEKTNEGHAYTWTEDGWAFDVRFNQPIRVEQVGCR